MLKVNETYQLCDPGVYVSWSEHFCLHELGEVAPSIIEVMQIDLSCVCPETLSVCKGPRKLLSLEYKKTNKQTNFGFV